MVPICMVNEETLIQIPDDVRLYRRALRRRIIDLEQCASQQRIAELEATNRLLQAERAALRALLGQQQTHIQQRQHQLADARAQLAMDSTNSSLPPSSDRFHCKRRPPPPPGQPRKHRGGQPGHRRQLRSLVPADQVGQTIACQPTTGRRCGKPLSGSDPAPLRHQVAELPVVRPEVVE
jgi:uncharacterized protein DUF6444